MRRCNYRRIFVSLLLCSWSSAACSAKESSKAKPAEDAQAARAPVEAIDGAPALDPGSVSPLARARDWQCPQVGETPRGGSFGPESVARAAKMHAGIQSVFLRSDNEGALVLSLLALDDIANERGLDIKQASPPRSVHVFRLLEDSWQDLGRPFQFTGWDTKLEVSIGNGPIHLAAESGVGDVRQSLVASCETSTWQHQARFEGKNFLAAALVSSPIGDETMSNIEIISGRPGLQGAACETPGGALRASDRPLRLALPGHSEPEHASVDLALSGDCRLARKFVADALADELAVSYELCAVQDGGDHASFSGCQIATLWHTAAGWRRMPLIEDLGGPDDETRHALALGKDGPLLAVTGAKGLRLYQAQGEAWSELPAASSAACGLPLALQSDPARLVSRSCDGYGQLTAQLLAGEEPNTDPLSKRAWRTVAKAMSLKPAFGAQQRPSVAATWIGETAYLAIGYQGAPVVRVFANAQQRWSQLLQAQVDPHPPAAPAR